MVYAGKHFIISGKVQGVFFRKHTQEQACQLGLHGWVKNLLDGKVEVKAFGETEQLEKLHQWLNQGPRLARVDSVIVETIPFETGENFEIFY